MKTLMLSTLLFLTFVTNAKEAHVLTSSELKEKVVQINNAQNKVMMQGSTIKDVEALFSLYTDDFVYVHEVYGGTYTREHLYNNTASYAKDKKYTLKKDRYKILRMIPGYNGIAVEREENVEGKSPRKHLTVFEFKGGKVSKIIEYWK